MSPKLHGKLRIALGAVLATACQHPGTLPSQTPPQSPSRQPSGGAEALAGSTLAVAGAAPADAHRPKQTAPHKSDGPLACVAGVDPELDKESPWSKELGQRLDRALPKLRACSSGASSATDAELTLRLVYAQDGGSLSQHVVASNPEGCAVSECVKEQLARVLAPKLLIERSSYDLALVFPRGKTPRRDTDPAPVLLEDDSEIHDPKSCVDPAIGALTRHKIQEVVSTTYRDLKGCYSDALVRDHEASGNVTFEFVIDQNGGVARAEARDASLEDCTAISCMLHEFRDLHFPAPVGRSVRIIYPISYVQEQPPVSGL
jgi:hypothetical protein